MEIAFSTILIWCIITVMLLFYIYQLHKDKQHLIKENNGDIDSLASNNDITKIIRNTPYNSATLTNPNGSVNGSVDQLQNDVDNTSFVEL